MTKNLLFLFFKTTKQKRHSQEPETAQKKLAEIGTQLRQYREQQSICLDKVAVVTMIRRNLLQAIEDGELDQLPEPVYTQGLIKRYAEAMGLDGAQFAEFFPIEPPARSRTKLSWQDGPQLRPMHLYLFYTFLIICSVNVLSQLMSGSVTAKNGAGAEELALGQQEQARLAGGASSSSQNQKPDSYEAVEAVRTGQNLNKSGNKPVMVNVTFKAESWMQVEVDGKTEFEGTLPTGTVRTWGAQKQLVVVAGNAGGVMVAVNNGQAEPLGDPGVAKEVVFKAKELNSSAPPKNEG
ncbi:RodZ domain-containing protein [Microcoleus sp. Pol12B4]|uniref:RodZ domain-containing protein n=1 Tax=Microcoleus sp. Pol12B4 TaxID=3055395 RepID=UPI002FD22C5E